MRRFQLIFLVVAVLIICRAGLAPAQTTVAGDAIDIEIYNPVDSSNRFVVAPGESFWAYVYLRPVDGTLFPDAILSCTRSCSGTVFGGAAFVATGAVDISFDTDMMKFIQATTHPDSASAAVDGIIQAQSTADGRIGWALAGDWTPNGVTTGTLVNPCDMAKLSAPGWLFRIQLQVTQRGTSTLHLRRETDPSPFALSFADACGSLFTAGNGMLDEIVDAVVTTDGSSIFTDGLESGNSTAWTSTVRR